MMLTVKSALLISLAYIGGLSWVLTRGSNREALTVPDAPQAPGVYIARAGIAADVLGAADGWDHRLEQPHPVPAEIARNQPAPVTLIASSDTPALPLPLATGLVAGGLRRDLAHEPAPPEPDALWPSAPSALTAAATPEPETAPTPTVTLAAHTATPAAAPLQTVKVARGDSLERLVRGTWGSATPADLAAWRQANKRLERTRDVLRVGDELIVPQRGGPAPAAAQREPESVTTGEPRWYTIQRRDSLERIAQRELKDGGRWPEILKLNPGLDAGKLVPGKRIRLPKIDRVVQR